MPAKDCFRSLACFLRPNSPDILLGYKTLLRENNIKVVFNIQSDLTNIKVSHLFPKYLFLDFPSCFDPQIAVSQYLLYRVGSSILVKTLYISAANGYHFIGPVPAIWYPTLEKYGFKPQKFLCRTLWFLFTLLFFSKAFLTGLHYLFAFLFPKNNTSNITQYAHFHNLPVSAVSSSVNKSLNSESLVSWFLDYYPPNSAFHISFYTPQKVNTDYLPYNYFLARFPFSCPNTIKYFLLYAFWFFGFVIRSLFSLINGSSFPTFLFHEVLLYKLAYFYHSHHSVPNYIVFNNSSFAFRPFWSYLYEDRSSNVVFLFYSTNCEVITPSSSPRYVIPSYLLMSWPKTHVWDYYQRDFIFFNSLTLKSYSSSSVIVSGPIPLSGNHYQLSTKKKSSLVIFDVSPFSIEKYASFSFPYDYYTYETIFKFYHDIFKATYTTNIAIYFKYKRNLSGSFDSRYNSLISSVTSEFGFLPIPSEASATSILQQSSFSISLPFTSTAVLAKYNFNQSIFYDPVGIFASDDPLAHGVPIVSGIDNLSTWISKLSTSP